MSHRDFLDRLRAAGSYDTPPEQVRHTLRRLRWLASLRFHVGNVFIVFRANHTARAGRYDREAWVKSSYDVIRAVEAAGGELHVEGYANAVGLDRPAVYIANHMSLLETFLLPCLVAAWRDASFIVKESLLTYPVFGATMRATHPIAVTRRNPREDLKQVLERGAEALASGRSVVVFPQSTRSYAFVENQFNSIGAKLAGRAGAPVVPIAVSTAFLANGRLFKDMGPVHPERPVHLAFGPPLTVTDSRLLHRGTVEFIRGQLARWGVPIENAPRKSVTGPESTAGAEA